MSSYSQFSLLKQRRFLPFFLVQALGAFNDNVYRQAIIGLLGFMAVSADEKALYAQLAPAIFILPYFLFSSIAGQFAEKLEKSRLIRITTAMEIAIMTLAAAGFMDLMNRVFKDFLDQFVIVFIDDILVYSSSEADHEQYLQQIL